MMLAFILQVVLLALVTSQAENGNWQWSGAGHPRRLAGGLEMEVHLRPCHWIMLQRYKPPLAKLKLSQSCPRGFGSSHALSTTFNRFLWRENYAQDLLTEFVPLKAQNKQPYPLGLFRPSPKTFPSIMRAW